MLYYINPLTWARWCLEFLVAWFASISWRGSIKALPAVVALLVMVGGTTLAWSHSREWRYRMIDRRLAEAFRAEEYEIIDLLLQRRIRQEPENQRLKLQLADVKEKSGDTEEATDLFRQLAFNERDASAASWLLTNRFDLEKRNEWEPAQFEEYGQLIEIALKGYPDDLRLNTLSADFHLRNQEPRLAIPRLEKLSANQPMRGFDLAALYRSLGDEQNAVSTATRTEAVIKGLIVDRPNDPVLRVAQAKLLIFLEKFQEAALTLKDGFEKSKDARLRPVLAQTYVLFADHLAKNSSGVDGLRMRLRLIREASNYAPADPLVMRAISDTIISTLNENDDQVAALRQELLAGAEPGIVHFIQGTVAMLKGKSELAKTELELAYRAMPQSAAILNNLAVAKTTTAKETNDTVALEEALALVNQALELTMKSPQAAGQAAYYLETRGQIFLALGRYSEAVTDLERLVTVEPLKRQVHAGLADAYKGLGQDEVAKLHADAAEKLTASQPASKDSASEALEVFAEKLRQQGAQGSPSQPSGDASLEDQSEQPATTGDE